MYYMSLLALSAFSGKKKYDNISELCLILDQPSFQNLIEVYGGQTLNIPTKEELSKYIQSICFIYYTDVEGLDRNKVLKKLDLEEEDIKNLPLKQIKKCIKSFNPIQGALDDK